MTFEEILQKFALPIVVMALIVMVLIGIIKIFTKILPDDNSKLKKVMSYIYVVMVPLFSFGVVCAYFGIFHLEFNWINIAKYSSTVWGCSQLLYPIYRDLGGRTLLLKVLNLFKGKSSKVDEIITLIETVIVLTTKQKEAVKEVLEKKIK